MLCSAGRYLYNGGSNRRRSILRDYNSIDSETITRSYNRTKILRIFYTVQDENETSCKIVITVFDDIIDVCVGVVLTYTYNALVRFTVGEDSHMMFIVIGYGNIPLCRKLQYFIDIAAFPLSGKDNFVYWYHVAQECFPDRIDTVNDHISNLSLISVACLLG